jgi:hypothetical protein
MFEKPDEEIVVGYTLEIRGLGITSKVALTSIQSAPLLGLNHTVTCPTESGGT